MTIEKLGTTTRFTRALGVVFIAVGAAFIVSAVVGALADRPCEVGGVAGAG